MRSATPRGHEQQTIPSPPPGNRTRPRGFEHRRAPDTPAGISFVTSVPSPGVEPGVRPSEGRVRFRHTPRASLIHRDSMIKQQGRKDSNPVREFWRLAALPGARPCSSSVFQGCPAGLEPVAVRLTISRAASTPRAPLMRAGRVRPGAEGEGVEPPRLVGSPAFQAGPVSGRVALPLFLE
jgi:hypothetical protein